MLSRRKPFFYISVILFLSSLFLLSFVISREQFYPLMVAFFLAFAILLFWIKGDGFQSEKSIWILAIISRLVFLFSIPMLSDDYFRFVWDGTLIDMGINPFAEFPEAIRSSMDMDDVFSGLNSKEYYSVYPPVMQLVFYISAKLAGSSLMLNVFYLKLILMISDLGLIYFAIKILRLLNMKVKAVMIYALNPLVIVEVVGNLHFEAMMMFFSLWGVYLLIKYKNESRVVLLILAAIIFSLGISTKLISILFLPVLFRWIGFKNALAFCILLVVFVVMSFIPFVDAEVIENFASSLDLYFRNFEFNASIYFLVNAIYSYFVGWEDISYVGPALSLLSIIVIMYLSFRRKVTSWQQYFTVVLFVLSTHLLFSTTIHPWYIINLLVISIFTNYRYVLLWTFTVVLSYYFYSYGYLPWFVLVIEYVGVFVLFMYEILSLRDVPIA